MTIGQRLRKMRKAHHITIKEVCEKTGVNNGTMSGIENDKYLPSAPTLIALSEFYNCSVDWILTGKNYIINPSPSELPQEAYNLAITWLQLPESDRMITGGDIYRRLEAAEEEKKSPDIDQVI